MKKPQPDDGEISLQLTDLHFSNQQPASHPRQFIQSNPIDGSSATQLVQGQNQQTYDVKDIMGVAQPQKPLNMEPSSLCSHGIMQAKFGQSGIGMNQGVSCLPLKGWPLTGIDQLHQNFAPQANKPFLPNQSQYQLLSSGPPNSTSTGNTAAPCANSGPSTPSIHTPGDDASMACTLQNSSTIAKSLMMHGTDKSGRVLSSSSLEDLETFGDVGSLDDNVESYQSNDDRDGRDIYAALKSNAENNVEPLTSFSFNENGLGEIEVFKVQAQRVQQLPSQKMSP
ncbi:hypothetical protein ZIOFF_022819 [Zingiber officinale]|uniref:Uncharacterized protein n=1 Tax=Zingiber officinale TaxID=94328 RepID=A0A8J5H226_ZINOF|nr:hypothetical protein ZIOFF_022819 [Zingiber officinale]